MPRPAILLALVAICVLGAAVAYRPVSDLWTQWRLVRSLQGADPALRLAAAIKLGRLGDPRAVPVLVQGMTATAADPARLEDSVAALCRVGGAAVPAIAAAFDDASADSAHLLEALGCIADAAALDVLATLLATANDDRLGTVVAVSSRTRDPRIAELVVQAASRADPARRLTLLASLGVAGGGSIHPRLDRLLSDAIRGSDPSSRATAIASRAWNRLNAAGSAGDWAPEAAEPVRIDLDRAAAKARALLAARQQPPGFWRTWLTPGPRFERARAEKNTYLTPLVVDMLQPVAQGAGLQQLADRARGQIASEIEANGLVRYYGRADPGDTAPPKRCTIPYDADDTALAWRVAPPSDPARLRSALAILSSYRADSGLFRTWLVPPGELACVDRGAEANPTDVGIQMHLILWLAQTSPTQAKALCSALRRAIGDDDIWVYYRRQPLVPMLRSVDLARAGCALSIPERYARTPIVGQGMWLAVARELQRLSARASDGMRREHAMLLLQRLAMNDFLAIRRSPPLLYQNDGTAKIPAYYWSADYGYALWLRLHAELKRGRS